MSLSVLHFQVFFGNWISSYGDHFKIEGRQRAIFWKSELGALFDYLYKSNSSESWLKWHSMQIIILILTKRQRSRCHQWTSSYLLLYKQGRQDVKTWTHPFLPVHRQEQRDIRQEEIKRPTQHCDGPFNIIEATDISLKW